jgi:hypothetical protein
MTPLFLRPAKKVDDAKNRSTFGIDSVSHTIRTTIRLGYL